MDHTRGPIVPASQPCILMANEPRAYREVIAAACRRLRPHLEVTTVEPDELDAQLTRCAHQVVVHSQRGAIMPAQVLAWVLLYPDGENHATISLGGEQTMTADVELDELLAILDRAVALAAARPPPATGTRYPGTTANDVDKNQRFSRW